MNEISEKAVEAAHAAYWSTDDGPSGNDRPAMRAALTAALPHLMGEVVAYARVHDKAKPHFHDIVIPDSQEAEMWAYDLIPLYAPTNQERGDG